MADTYDTPEQTEQTAPIRAFVLNSDALSELIVKSGGFLGRDMPGDWLDFPTTKEAVQETLKAIGIDSITQKNFILDKFDTDIPGLLNKLPRGADMDEINMLASKLDVMTESELEVFCAVMLSCRHSGSVMDIINVTENLGLFDLQPAYSLDMYGEFLAIMGQDEYAWAIERLQNFSDPDMRDFAQYVLRLERHFDCESYAWEVIKAENGVFTGDGYLREDEGFKEIYATVPPEYRVSVIPEPEARAPAERPSAMERLAAAKETVSRTEAANPTTPPKSHDVEL